MIKQIAEDWKPTVHLMQHPKDIKLYCNNMDQLRGKQSTKDQNISLNSTADSSFNKSALSDMSLIKDQNKSIAEVKLNTSISASSSPFALGLSKTAGAFDGAKAPEEEKAEKKSQDIKINPKLQAVLEDLVDDDY